MGAYELNAYALPVVILSGVVIWYRYDRRRDPFWRRWIVVVGLLLDAANVGLYLRLRVYGGTRADLQVVGMMLQQSSGVAIWLVGLALACAIVGKGVSRVPVAIASIMGIFLWVVPAVL